MKKVVVMLFIFTLSACSNQATVSKTDSEWSYTSKPVFCYQLPPEELQPNKNCIGSGGHQ